MKNTIKLLGIIALVAVIGFSMASCASMLITIDYLNGRENFQDQNYAGANSNFAKVIKNSHGKENLQHFSINANMYLEAIQLIQQYPDFRWELHQEERKYDNGGIVNGPTGVITITSYVGTGSEVTIPKTNNFNIYIGENAFKDKKQLASVTISDSVTAIDYRAFRGCAALVEIQVADGNTAYCSIDGIVYVKDQKIVVLCPQGKAGAVTTIPDSVTSIGMGAFRDCTSLIGITIPNSVTSIGDGAFFGCTSLTGITIPNSITSIGIGAFSYSALTNITIPSSVTSIGDWVFDNCTALTTVTIPASVTSIGQQAFSGCESLSAVTIPSSVTSIGEGAFVGSALTNITIPNSVASIGEGAFGCNDLTRVTFQGTIPSSGFGSKATFGPYKDGRVTSGNLMSVYFAANGGPGTYTRSGDHNTWVKQ